MAELKCLLATLAICETNVPFPPALGGNVGTGAHKLLYEQAPPLTIGSTVEPACKVLGFVLQKLNKQEGFCCLTLQPSIFVNEMAT